MENHSQPKKSYQIALGGILLSMTTICAYLAGILPTNKLSLLGVSAFLTGIIVVETGLKNASIYVLAGLGTGFLVLAGKPILLLYGLFFLPYGLIRSVSDKLSVILGFVIRLIYFNMLMFFLGFVFKTLNMDIDNILNIVGDNKSIAYAILIIGANLAFIAFDWLFGKFMYLYVNQFRKKIFRNDGNKL